MESSWKRSESTGVVPVVSRVNSVWGRGPGDIWAYAGTMSMVTSSIKIAAVRTPDSFICDSRLSVRRRRPDAAPSERRESPMGTIRRDRKPIRSCGELRQHRHSPQKGQGTGRIPERLDMLTVPLHARVSRGEECDRLRRSASIHSRASASVAKATLGNCLLPKSAIARPTSRKSERMTHPAPKAAAPLSSPWDRCHSAIHLRTGSGGTPLCRKSTKANALRCSANTALYSPNTDCTSWSSSSPRHWT
jgi:hypothetical protein